MAFCRALKFSWPAWGFCGFGPGPGGPVEGPGGGPDMPCKEKNNGFSFQSLMLGKSARAKVLFVFGTMTNRFFIYFSMNAETNK
jgi:hypothetical protein